MRGLAPILVAAASLLLHSLGSAYGLSVSNRYRSPRNPERKVRTSTKLIVLHTTEAPARSSLNKLSERGECHYCVTEAGDVYRIVDRDRQAFHAGRSVWNGTEDVDNCSIGIECVGYHDKPMPAVQLLAIRDLVKELKRMYRISDESVVCHSHVAYGMPNRWHKRKHRGRKQCGMLFAMPSVRRVLELKSRPRADPDQKSGRVVQGDPYLQTVLYGSVDTMKGRVSSAPPPKTQSKSFMEWIKPTIRPAAPSSGAQPSPAAKSPPAGKSPSSVRAAPSRKTAASRQTPAPKKTAGSRKTATAAKPAAVAPPTSVAELKARGYRNVGTVAKGRPASKLAGKKWNDRNTFYSIRDKVVPGNRVDPKHIEAGTTVWIR